MRRLAVFLFLVLLVAPMIPLAQSLGSGSGIFGGGSMGSGSGVDCVEVAAWTPCSGTTACTFLSDSCVTWTDMSSTPAYYGAPFSLDMDIYTHLKILLMGREGTGQTGTVTINLRDRTNGVTENTAVSTTIPSGETCVSRASTTQDLTSLTGIHSFVLQISDSTNLDDPGLSTIVVQACSGAF